MRMNITVFSKFHIYSLIAIVALVFYFKNSLVYAYQPIIKPTTIKTGDTVGLISSASPLEEHILIEQARKRIEELGLKVKYGKNLYKRYGWASCWHS